ncbi:MAG: glycosyltransferase, partial [Lachnospiraceae bacterium]|nr:glycosyltransferase [Lachnospiraceae bacterium]
LIEKCDFYLTHEEIRKKIAQNGYETVCANHTWKLRLAQMLKVLTS